MISILMPAYNAAQYLTEAIESVLAQTQRDFELVIIDDGSTDQTLTIAQTYAARDSRIRVLSHPNMGMGASLNHAMEQREAEWIMRMDTDDVMLPHRIARQVAFVRENTDLAVAGSLVYYINENDRVLGTCHSPFIERTAARRFVRENRLIALNHPSVVMRKHVVQEVGGYRPQFWPADDVDLWNRIAEQGHDILVQPEYLLKYRVHAASVSIASARQAHIKVSWVQLCMEQRRLGKSEPTWEQFLAHRNNMPLLPRLNQSRREFARTLYNISFHQLSMRRYRAMLPAVALASILEPGYVLPRVLGKVCRKSPPFAQEG